MPDNYISITHEQFMDQWIDRKSLRSNKANKLSYNIEEFITKSGDFAKRKFISSFNNMGFNGVPWQPRAPHNSKFGPEPTHPLMNETGALKGGIKGEVDMFKSKSHKGGGRYWIHTTEDQHVRPNRKRGTKGISTGALGYAAVHNSDPRTNDYTVNQYSSRKPIQRQFIGFSNDVDGFIFDTMTDMIFEGLP